MNSVEASRRELVVVMRAWLFPILTGAALIAGSAIAALPATPKYFDHPGEIALHESSPGVWHYRTFPALMPIYTYDPDPPGKATCYKGCAAAWPPVRARPDAKPVGDWTIIARDDRVRQWAYKGKPVYVRYHDRVANPQGDGEEGKWRLLVP